MCIKKEPRYTALRITAVFIALLYVSALKPASSADTETDTSDERIVFTKFKNNSGDPTLDYLSLLLPNAFASSFKKSGHSTLNATDSNTEITDEAPDFSYPPSKFVFKTLASHVNAEFLISGSFVAQEGTISLNFMIYSSHGDELMTFTVDGPIDSKMFTLVDKMNRVISRLATENYVYKTQKIEKNARVAVLSNLTGENYNQLVQAFLSGGNKVAAIQGNDLSCYLPDKQFSFFSSLASSKTSIERNYSKGDFTMVFQPWKSKERLKEEKKDTKLAYYYYNNAALINAKALNSLSDAYGSIDYFFFINISWDTGRFWLRCYNTGKNELIWIESGKIVAGEKKHSYAKTASYILSRYEYLSR